VFDWKRDNIANQYDELPLWSSPLGLLLMDNFPIGNYKHHLDRGCGTGFPLIDISQRLGSSCKAYGMDPWHAAINRSSIKIETIGLKNVELIESDASVLPGGCFQEFIRNKIEGTISYALVQTLKE